MHKKTEILPQIRQKVWGWPAVCNFVLCGMAAGFYLFSSLLLFLKTGTHAITHPFAFKLVSPAMTCIGFLVLTIEAGRPLGAHRLLSHQKGSWMSREVLFGTIFILASVGDWLFLYTVLWAIAAMAAMGLVISQSFLIYNARAVTAWNRMLVVIIFITSSLMMGSGLLLIVPPSKTISGSYSVLIGLFCILLDFAALMIYLNWRQSDEIHDSTRALRQRYNLVFTAGIGHLLPVLLLILLLIGPEKLYCNSGWYLCAILAGITMVLGGANLKAGIILDAGYLRPIVLDSIQA